MADHPTDSAQANAPEEVLMLDGEIVDADDLSFAEMRTFRALVRELFDDETMEVDDKLAGMDSFPALITVWKRRTDPDYQLADALKIKLRDVIRERPTPEAAKPAAKKKAALSGAQP